MTTETALVRESELGTYCQACGNTFLKSPVHRYGGAFICDECIKLEEILYENWDELPPMTKNEILPPLSIPQNHGRFDPPPIPPSKKEDEGEGP